MEHLDKLLEIVDGELTSISKNGKFRTRDEIDAAYKLIDIAKDIHCIWEYEEDEESDEYSRMGPYYGGNSYARGRRGSVKRDSMGRYSRRGPMYSRASGKEEYVEHLREMMETAPDEQTRAGIERMVRKMEESM